MTELELLKKTLGDSVKEHEPLARLTTFKIGGPADLFYEATTTDALITAVIEARKLSIPVFVLGGGTNILIGDKGIRGLVVKNSTSRTALRGVLGGRIGGDSE